MPSLKVQEAREELEFIKDLQEENPDYLVDEEYMAQVRKDAKLDKE